MELGVWSIGGAGDPAALGKAEGARRRISFARDLVLVNQTTRQHLEMLWAQSAQLRANAMAARMAAMEARAVSRSLLLQRSR